MDVGLWSELPTELLERVLPFLPVPDLYRFRNVCKRWNSLICTPEFGKLCVQSASRGGASAGACLVSKLRVYSSWNCLQTEIPSWSVLDLNEKRWYTITNSLLKGFKYDVAALDGGLVCTFVNSFTSEQRCESTYLCNPECTKSAETLVISSLIGGRIKVLPNPPLGFVDVMRMNLKLAVENISNTYRIFLIYKSFLLDLKKYPCYSVCVYESSTNQWRRVPHPPGFDGTFGPHVRSVVFEGLLYVLFCSSRGFINRLYKFDPLEDAWEDTGVHFRQSAIDLCDLVVSDDRLFLVTQHLVDHIWERAYRIKKMRWPLDISEILLADKACRTVVQMTETGVRRNLSIDSTIDCGAKVQQFQLRAFGSDKSVLLMCEETGKVMRYNLETEVWDLFPPNPAEVPHLESICHGLLGSISRHGKQMSCLRLPNAPW